MHLTFNSYVCTLRFDTVDSVSQHSMILGYTYGCKYLYLRY